MPKKTKKFIIITSIFDPSEAVRKFSTMSGWQIVVVGDKKTPKNWKHKNVTYLSPEDQLAFDFEVLKLLPWNHYCRKMVGYLYAMSQGAEVIYDTDDDNIPLDNWHEPEFDGRFNTLSGAPFINIYRYFTNKKVWPRGYPLKSINASPEITEKKKSHKIRIWQFLADGDPDVDAIYRLTDNEQITFEKRDPYVLEHESFSPINSQNTFFHKDAFFLLYLPAFVTFRFTDILRGLVAQPILWTKGYSTGFGTATVFQDRNKHDFQRDFESEVPVYLYAEKITYLAKDTAKKEISIDENLINIYKELLELDIVTRDEIALLRAWIADVKKIRNKSSKIV